MKLMVESYATQHQRWPAQGQHILAQFFTDYVVVYQAYNRAIGSYAAKHGTFGGDFSFHRMSWIKTNFLWMMYRSNWGTSENQEVVLAIKLKRAGFEQILAEAVHSSFNPELHESQAEWNAALHRSNVRLQWDPDHNPYGAPQERRAIQLGLKGTTLQKYAREWILKIHDISDLVAEQRANMERGRLDELLTPVEEVYPLRDKKLARRIGVSSTERTAKA